MDHNWQMGLTIACVAIAAALLGLRVWRTFRSTKAPQSCGGGCSSCPAATPGENRQLIQLEFKTSSSVSQRD
jgi:hypothetical protein